MDLFKNTFKILWQCVLLIQALEKAKEAGRKERVLLRQREQTGTADHINLDLTYSVSLFLINQSHN